MLSIRGQDGRQYGGGFLAWSGDLELLVAEVGDELEGSAERGDEAVQDVLGGDVAAFDLGDPDDRDAHPGGYLLLGPPAVWTARSRWPESRQRDTSLIGPSAWSSGSPTPHGGRRLAA